GLCHPRRAGSTMLDAPAGILDTSRMKAVRAREFGGPQVLRLEELSEPQAGPGQVVVRVRAVGVNPVDTSIRTGAYSKIVTPPYTPGSDAAGVVEAAGDGV